MSSPMKPHQNYLIPGTSIVGFPVVCRLSCSGKGVSDLQFSCFWSEDDLLVLPPDHPWNRVDPGQSNLYLRSFITLPSGTCYELQRKDFVSDPQHIPYAWVSLPRDLAGGPEIRILHPKGRPEREIPSSRFSGYVPAAGDPLLVVAPGRGDFSTLALSLGKHREYADTKFSWPLYDSEGETEVTRFVGEGTINTVPGDCGSPVFGPSGLVGVVIGYGDPEGDPTASLPSSFSGNAYVPFMSRNAVLSALRVRSRTRGPSQNVNFVKRLRRTPQGTPYQRIGSPPRRRAPLATSFSPDSIPTRCGATQLGKKSHKKAGASVPPVATAAGLASLPVKPKVAQNNQLVSIQAPGSDYIGSPGTLIGGKPMASAKRYVDSLMNPWAFPASRLPDASIAPTATFRLFKNATYTVPSGSNSLGLDSIMFAMHSRMSNFNPSVPAGSPYGLIKGTASGVSEESTNVVYWSNFGNSGTPGQAETQAAVYNYQPGNILFPVLFPSSQGPTITPMNNSLTAQQNWRYIDGLTAYDYNTPWVSQGRDGPWASDFGSDATNLSSWSAAYRTNAMAMRFRVTGLPSGQFMANGKLYIAQVRADSEDIPLTEQDYVVLERVNRASHVSLEAVRAGDSKTYYVVPDGTEKFQFSSSFLPAAGNLLTNSHDASAPNTVRVFPSAINICGCPPDPGHPAEVEYDLSYLAASATASPSGAIAPATANTFKQLLVPYTSSQSSGSASDAAVADGTYMLIAAAFGVADGVTIEVDYAMTGEIQPDNNVPPSVETAVELPSAVTMDEILSNAAVLTGLRPLLLQKRGDITQFETPPGLDPSPAAQNAARAARNMVSRAVQNARRTGSVRASQNGFWDILSNAAGAALSSLGSSLESDSSHKVRKSRS